jgi:hypothetical protein
VRYALEQFDDPIIPDFWINNTWNDTEPGYLTQAEAYPSLISAIIAAKIQAEIDCNDENRCCSEITISVKCLGEPGGLDFQKLGGKEGRPVLCGKTWKINCKKKTWSPAGFPKL